MTRYHRTLEGRVPFTQAEEDAQDVQEKAWADGASVRNARDEIERLENTITNRRLRDALASDEGKVWVAEVEAKIATERRKL